MVSIGYVDMPPCQKPGFIEIDLARHAAVLFAMLPSFLRMRNHFQEAAGFLSLFRAAMTPARNAGIHAESRQRSKIRPSSDTPLANNLFM